MSMATTRKSKFTQLNSKRFYISNGVVSLPFSHPLLKELNKYMDEFCKKIEEMSLKEKKQNVETGK